MLTSRRARVHSASWAAALVGAAMILSMTTLTAAHAADVTDTSCVGGWRGYNCVTQSGSAGDPYVRLVPETLDDAEKARLADRERNWRGRCNPTIEYDRYGVPRYSYGAPGCEFGVGEE